MLLELLSAITTKMLYLILHIENAGSFPKPLSAKEEKKALEQMASGDTEAKKSPDRAQSAARGAHN